MNRSSATRLLAVLTVFAVPAFFAAPLAAHEIEQCRGVDPEVDYESLTRYGPWDDRNYELTAADLELLANNEDELQEPIPAFFRVLIRRKWKEETGGDLPRTGPAQYPRSAAQIFRQQCGGFLLDGMIYNATRWEDGRYVVIRDNGEPAAGFGQGKDCVPPTESARADDA